MFVIDIEGRGKSASRNGIVSIGVCVGEATGNGLPRVIEKRRFDLAIMADQVMDPTCKREFWDKQPNGLLETLQVNAVEATDGIKAFRDYLDMYDKRVPNLYVLCDNPSYDFGFIDYYLDQAALPVLQFRADGSYRPLHDADSYTRGVLGLNASNQWADNKKIAAELGLQLGDSEGIPHMPEDDAEAIYRFHFALVNRGAAAASK